MKTVIFTGVGVVLSIVYCFFAAAQNRMDAMGYSALIGLFLALICFLAMRRQERREQGNSLHNS